MIITFSKTKLCQYKALILQLIKWLNDSPFGLGGSVFTQDIERGKRVADQIDTGMVFINHPTSTQADLPLLAIVGVVFRLKHQQRLNSNLRKSAR